MPYYGQITGTGNGVEGSWFMELDDEAVPGGWHDPWDDPDNSAELRVQATAAERRRRA